MNSLNQKTGFGPKPAILAKEVVMRHLITAVLVTALFALLGTTNAYAQCQADKLLNNPTLVQKYWKKLQACKKAPTQKCVDELKSMNKDVKMNLGGPYKCTWTSPELTNKGFKKITSLADLGGGKPAKPAAKGSKPAAKGSKPAAKGSKPAAKGKPEIKAKSGAKIPVYFNQAALVYEIEEAIGIFNIMKTVFDAIVADQVADVLKLTSDKKNVKSVVGIFDNSVEFAVMMRKRYKDKLTPLVLYTNKALALLHCTSASQGAMVTEIARMNLLNTEVQRLRGEVKAAETKPKEAQDKVDAEQAKIKPLADKVAEFEAIPKRKRRWKRNKALRQAAESAASQLTPLRASLAQLLQAKQKADQELKAVKDKLAAKQKALADARKAAQTKSKKVVWSCKGNADRKLANAFLGHIKSNVTKDERERLKPWIARINKAKDAKQRLLATWGGVSVLDKPNRRFLTEAPNLSLKGGLATEDKVKGGDNACFLTPDDGICGEFSTSSDGDTVTGFDGKVYKLGKVRRAFKLAWLSSYKPIGPRLFGKSLWPWFNKRIPPIRLAGFGSFSLNSSSTDTRHNIDYDVFSQMAGGGISIGVEPVLKRWKHVALFLGFDVAAHYRSIVFRDETSSNKVESSNWTLDLGIRPGINFKMWGKDTLSIYGVGSIRPVGPFGGSVGAGLELSRWFIRPAFEWRHDWDENQVNTSVPRSAPADHRGHSLLFKGVVVF
jgi:hypothetical protein